MPTPAPQQAIDKVNTKYATWVLGSIKRTYEATKNGEEGSTPLTAFILISCAIDFLAGFMCGITSFQPKGPKREKAPSLSGLCFAGLLRDSDCSVYLLC